MSKKDYKFKEQLEGINQCQVCGYSEAKGEGKLHSICHNRFTKMRETYGENVLTYENLVNCESRLEKIKLCGYNSVLTELEDMFTELKAINDIAEEEINNKKKALNSVVKTSKKELKDATETIKLMKANCKKEIASIEEKAAKQIEELKLNYGFFVNNIIPENIMIDYILNLLYTVKYTRSLKFWDFYRPHPKYDEYITLLWNTPSFITYVSDFVPMDVVEMKSEELKANRKLKETSVLKNEFVFINVLSVDDLDSCSGVINLDYIDNLLNADYEEEDDIVEEDIDDTAEFFKALLMNSRKKYM